MRSIVVLVFLGLLPGCVLGQGSASGVGNKTTDGGAKYAAESIVDERQDTVYRYAPDGTGSKELTAVLRIQSEAAARQFGVFTIPFAGSSERVEIDYVRVRKPDGSTVETPAADAQEMPQEVTRQAPFYSDLKEEQLPVRNLRVGDKLEYKVRIVETKAEVPGEFWGQESFGSGVVILDESLELHVPKEKYVKVWSPEHAPAKSESGNEIVYRWTGSQLEPTINKDGKVNQREVDPDGELPTIAWTSFKAWEEIGTWYRGLEADRVLADADVKTKVAELTAGKMTEEDKVRALYGYVATQVRYIGVAFGVGRYQPHPAREVLQNQYGDCKDKHTLLAAMLTSAGFHPEAVLIGAGIRMNDEVPSPAAFNHMITKVPVNGKQVWLDTTAEIAPYQVLLSVIRDKQALVIPETGAPKIERTPATLPFANFAKFLANGTLSKDGVMKAQMEYVSRGDDELAMRAMLRQVPPGQWDQMVQQLSQGLGFGGTTSHAEASRPDITDVPVKLTYDYEREKFGDWDNYKIVPLFPTVFLNPVDEKNPPKKQPIELGTPRVETSISIIKLPDGWGADLPDAVHQKTEFASFDKTYKIDHEKITVERRIEIFKKRVPAADWKEYKKWMDATLSNGETFIQLTSTGLKPGELKEKGPPAAGTENEGAAKLVSAAYEAVRRHDLDSAEQELDLAKGLNPNQPSLWSTYGYLAFQRKQWEKAVDAYGKELALYPDTSWIYGAMAQAQNNMGHKQDAKETLRKRLAVAKGELAASNLLATLLMADNENVEAVKVLKVAAATKPEDKGLLLRLGRTEMTAGEKPEGVATLVALLKDSTDTLILNDAAYELANANVELDLAEKSCTKALEMLTTESAAWTLDGDAKSQAAKSTLLIATWDTMGWILFREGKLDEAEGYVQAAWRNNGHAEIGLHLGEIEEALGNRELALTVYHLAQLSQPTIESNGAARIPVPVDLELERHVNALLRNGLKYSSKDEVAQMRKLKKLRADDSDHESGIADYEILLSEDRVNDVRPSPDAATVVKDGVAKVRGIDFKGWTPPGSKAKLRFRGLLNCHNNACELERLPI